MFGEKYITARGNGSLYATSDCMDAKEKFIITIINRPILVLRGNYGFVSVKPDNRRIECNKSTYSIVKMQYTKDGSYYLKGR